MNPTEGKFLARVISAAPKIHEGPNGEKWFVWAMFHVIPFDIQMGVRLWLTTDKALRIARKSLKAMGMQIDGVDTGQVLLRMRENPVLLAGNEVDVVIQEKEWQGVTSLEIAWVNVVRTAEMAKDESSQLSDISKRLQGLKSAGSDSKPAPPKGAAPPPPPPAPAPAPPPEPPPPVDEPTPDDSDLGKDPPGDIPF